MVDQSYDYLVDYKYKWPTTFEWTTQVDFKKKKKRKEKKLIDYIHTMEIWLQVDYNKKWLQVLVWG